MKRFIFFLGCLFGLFYILHNSPDTKSRKVSARDCDTVVIFHKDTVFVQIPNPVDSDVDKKDNNSTDNPRDFAIIPDKIISSSEKVFKIVNYIEITYQPDTTILQKQEISKHPVEFMTFSGSGFAIKNNLVVTAAHVVIVPECFLPHRWGYKTSAKTKQLRVYISDNFFMEARIDTVDVGNDAAILSLGEQARFPSLRLNTGSLEKFEPLWTAGYPDGENGVTVTPAQVFYATQNSSTAFSSGQTRDMIDFGHEKVMRLSGGGDRGISGGPIFDQDGMVVGIIVQLNDRGTTAYGTPAELIERLLREK